MFARHRSGLERPGVLSCIICMGTEHRCRAWSLFIRFLVSCLAVNASHLVNTFFMSLIRYSVIICLINDVLAISLLSFNADRRCISSWKGASSVKSDWRQTSLGAPSSAALVVVYTRIVAYICRPKLMDGSVSSRFMQSAILSYGQVMNKLISPHVNYISFWYHVRPEFCQRNFHCRLMQIC